MKLLNYFKYPDYQDSHVNKHDLVSIYFSADWCEPCVGMNFMLVSKSGIGSLHQPRNPICGKRFYDVLYPAGWTKYLFIFSVYDHVSVVDTRVKTKCEDLFFPHTTVVGINQGIVEEGGWKMTLFSLYIFETMWKCQYVSVGRITTYIK